MSDQKRPPELQFEHAETASSAAGAMAGARAGAPHCAVCSSEIVSSYWEHRGRMLCEACRAKLIESWSQGSGFGRFARAALFGLLAAAAGTLVYWAVAELTGYEFSLIALLIGIAVGGAVRYGARGRGGWRYQALAIFLTYTSIVSTYLPALWQAARTQDAAESATQTPPAAVEPPLPPGLKVREALPADPAPAQPLTVEPEDRVPAETTVPEGDNVVPGGDASEPEPAAPEAEAPAVPSAEFGFDSQQPSLAGCFVGVLALVAFLYAAPFLGGFENFIGWIILAIGLYEAWKMNQPEDREVRGPFAVGGRPSPQAPPPPPLPATPA
jgi:hypothetical protein